MSLLFPLFMLGAAALVLPVIFHLIRRSTREKTQFSSLMFLLQSPPRITRRSRLENIFLLLLRCAVICLLALAFARPFFQKAFSDPRPSTEGKTVVVLLDTSASMRRENLWADAKKRAQAIIASLSPLDRATVLAFDQTIRPLLTFEEWEQTEPAARSSALGQRLNSLSPNWTATYLDQALIRAAEILDESQRARGAGEELRQIIAVTDFQAGSRLSQLQDYTWPRDVQVRVETVKPKRPTNASVQWISERDEGGAVSVTRPRVRVSNSPDSGKERFQVLWKATSAITPVQAYVPPGQNRIVQVPTLPEGVAGHSLVLTGDDAEFDNEAFIAQAAVLNEKILYLANDPETDSTRPLYYLKRAFQDTRRQKVVIETGAAALASLSNSDAHFAVVTTNLPPDAIARLRQWINGGRLALIALHNTNMIAVVAELAGIASLPCTEAEADTYSMFGQIDFQHPLFAAFADPRYSDFTKIHFWKHRRIAAEALPNSRVLARFDNGDPGLLEFALAKGKVLVLTAGWHPAESQLALSSKFVPLLYSMLDLSGAPVPRSAQYFVLDTIELSSAGEQNNASWTVRKPDSTTLVASNSFSDTEMPGIYTFTSLQATQKVAVNLAPVESRTGLLPIEELQRLQVPLEIKSVRTAAQVEQQRRRLHATEMENQQKLWRWLIVAAVVILVVETWLAASLTRRSTVQASQA